MVAAGLQDKFSWKSVAASAVSAAVATKIGDTIFGAPGFFGGLLPVRFNHLVDVIDGFYCWLCSRWGKRVSAFRWCRTG